MFKLSIITCTYNSAKHISKCIQSVIDQNLNPECFEHIFVDGQSSDSTIEIIKKYQEHYPKFNIIILISPPKGIYNAMNIGRKHAKWQYVNFLNSDDRYISNTIPQYLEYIFNNKKDFYYSQAIVKNDFWDVVGYNPYSKVTKQWLRKYLIYFVDYINHQTVFMKNNLKEKVWYFDESFKLAADWLYWIKLSQFKVSSIYYDNSTVEFLEGSASASANKTLQSTEIFTVRNLACWKYTAFFYNLIYCFFLFFRKLIWTIKKIKNYQ